jgi:hypothetical protein
LENEIDGRAALHRFERGGDVREDAGLRGDFVTPDEFVTSAMTIESGSSIHVSSCFAFGTESLQFGEYFVVYI